MRLRHTVIGMVLCAMCLSCSHGKDAVANQAIKVEVMAVRQTMLTGARIYFGDVEESEGIDVSFPVAGMMDSVYVNAGDFVEKGHVIGRINSRSLQSALQSAQEALRQAQAKYDEMKAKRDSRKLSDMDWAEARSALLKAKGNVALAEKTLNDATLYAPFSGYVSERYCDAGRVVATTTPVIKLAKIDDAHVVISVPGGEISNLAIGDTAYITIDRPQHRQFVGKVAERSTSAQPSSGEYAVRIEVENRDYTLRPDMNCRVKINSAAPEMGVVVPQSVVLHDSENGQFVWLAYRGKALKRAVATGGVTDGGVIIESGLSSGDTIITNGRLNISESATVLIANR